MLPEIMLRLGLVVCRALRFPRFRLAAFGLVRRLVGLDRALRAFPSWVCCDANWYVVHCFGG